MVQAGHIRDGNERLRIPSNGESYAYKAKINWVRSMQENEEK